MKSIETNKGENIMESLITGLAPAFVVGLALQALIEWMDGPIFENLLLKILSKIVLGKSLGDLNDEDKKKFKAGVVRTFAIVVGIIFAYGLKINVLAALNMKISGKIGYLVTGFIISMGTDGVNQILKFMEKAKDNQSETAKSKRLTFKALNKEK
jgi:hypothetical protein